jgi:hypothetical protein
MTGEIVFFRNKASKIKPRPKPGPEVSVKSLPLGGLAAALATLLAALPGLLGLLPGLLSALSALLSTLARLLRLLARLLVRILRRRVIHRSSPFAPRGYCQRPTGHECSAVVVSCVETRAQAAWSSPTIGAAAGENRFKMNVSS